jgi:hypothetical protein
LVIEHAVTRGAVGRGAKVAVMPALSCMAQVTDRGLTFAEAMDGRAKNGNEPPSLFDRARVNRWWTRDVPEFFGRLPAEWVPSAPQEAAPSGSEAG